MSLNKLHAYTALAVIPILITLGAGMWYAFPFWDDAWLFMLVKEHGLGAVRASIPDRPLAALIIDGSLRLNLLSIVIISLVLWVILGILAARLQDVLFPSLEGYKPLSVILTISPVLAKPHLAIFNATPTALLAVVLGYFGLLALHRYVISDTERRFLLITGMLLFAVGILISEYAMPCALITIILLIPRLRKDQSKQQSIRAIALLLVVMAVTYSFAALRARANTSPLYPLQQFRGMAINFPFTLAGAIWQTLIGAYTESLGYLSQLSLRDKPRLLCMALGVLTALPLIAACRKGQSTSIKTILVPLAALIVGILPMCLMYRVPYPETATRLFLPLTPLASALFVFLLFKAFNHKLWAIPVLLVGLMCGSATGSLAITSVQMQRSLNRYSEILKREVMDSKNLVIAVVPVSGMDYEIAGKIAKDWPLELESRFWAYDEPMAAKYIGSRENCRLATYNREIRLIQRQAPVDKVIKINEAGYIEPYCYNKNSASH